MKTLLGVKILSIELRINENIDIFFIIVLGGILSVAFLSGVAVLRC